MKLRVVLALVTVLLSGSACVGAPITILNIKAISH